MEDKYEVRSLSSSDLSTILHGGLAEKQETKLSREIYLCEARVYGIRDVKLLKEYLSRVSLGNVVRLYRRVYDQLPAVINSDIRGYPDDGHNVRIHTFDGGCLGYMQPPERYAVADLMLTGQKLYAKVSFLSDDCEMLDTWNAVKLDVYWVIESDPLSMDLNVYESAEENGLVLGAFKGDVLLDDLPIDLRVSDEERVEPVRMIRCQERLMVYKGSRGSVDVSVRTMDGEYKAQTTFLSQTVYNLLDAGKTVYAVVEKILSDMTEIDGDSKCVRAQLKFYLEMER